MAAWLNVNCDGNLPWSGLNEHCLADVSDRHFSVIKGMGLSGPHEVADGGTDEERGSPCHGRSVARLRSTQQRAATCRVSDCPSGQTGPGGKSV